MCQEKSVIAIILYVAKKIFEVRDAWPYGKEKKYSKETITSG